MIRLTDRLVHLNIEEANASDHFDDLLDEGMSIIEAVDAVAYSRPNLSEEFLDYLRNG